MDDLNYECGCTITGNYPFCPVHGSEPKDNICNHCWGDNKTSQGGCEYCKPEKFKENFGLVFYHDFVGPLHHWSKSCDQCGEIYGKHIRNEINEMIITLEDMCSCEEGRACKPHYAIDLFKRIIGEV